jgi:membrane protease YdiL (CAAX protease family)
VTLALGALLVLVWASWTKKPLRELGFARPRSWAWTIAAGVVAGVAFKLLMKSVVMPLLGAPPINQAYSFLTGNSAALPGMTFSILLGAGFGEETLYRGFLFDRLGKWFGGGRGATITTVLLTSLLFAVVHYPVQELPGTQQAFIVGLAMGALYARTRSLWLPMIIHVAFDLTALWIIYRDLERTVASWFFR